MVVLLERPWRGCGSFGYLFGEKGWGWNLALVIAAGSFVGYILSRTVGLPDIPPEPDAWLEPLGVASLTAEGLFIILFLKTAGLRQHKQ